MRVVGISPPIHNQCVENLPVKTSQNHNEEQHNYAAAAPGLFSHDRFFRLLAVALKFGLMSKTLIGSNPIPFVLSPLRQAQDKPRVSEVEGRTVTAHRF